MLLERLVLENYGVYKGRSEIDLSASEKKPIILVGGLNGAGKTTLFESIMIALYGKAYLGPRTAKSHYLGFIADRIHRGRNGRRAGHASVEVAFRFYHNGSDDHYTVIRSWYVEGASVSEALDIQKNGEPMEDVNESLWQSFIDGLIPIGIARLFFFDGEKIVRVTKWNEEDNEEIKASMDVLLGTDLINRLDTDLDLYTVRKSGSKSDDKVMQAKYEELLKEKDGLASDCTLLAEECKMREEELDSIMSQISAKESKIAGIGGGYAEMRSGLLTQKAVLEEKLRHLGKEIRDELSDDAPMYLATGILDDVSAQIDRDVDVMRQRFSMPFLQDMVDAFKKDLGSKRFWPGKSVDRPMYKKICSRLDKMIKEPTDSEFFDISLQDVERMRQSVTKAREGPGELLCLLGEYGRIGKQLAQTESDLAKIPRDDEIGPRISEINDMHQEVGMLKAEIANANQTISSKQAYRKMLQSQIKTLVDSIYGRKTAGAGLELATRMKEVLSTYYCSIRERKIRELEGHLLDSVQILLHKDMISKITVDRDTFEIRVYRNGGDEPVPGDTLSMGERQMIGTALLWSIARTCGRALPFVIDTPLGRLDGEHRANLAKRFYPFASHQTILLSTDTEIRRREHRSLSKYVARSYRIEYDQKKASTSIHDGYFLEEKIA